MAEEHNEQPSFFTNNDPSKIEREDDLNPVPSREADHRLLPEDEEEAFAIEPTPRKADGDNYTEECKPAYAVPGEFLVPLCDIHDWKYHLRTYSPRHAEHAAALALTATDPSFFRPIELVLINERYHLKDGRYILESIKDAHPNDPTIPVRAIVFPGTEEEAVADMCDTALGSSVATKMEMAHGLLSLQRACRISQTAMADRYPGLNHHKVSRMLIAAQLQEELPDFFDILEAPHKAPISYGVAVKRAIRNLPEEQIQALLDRATQTASSGTRYKPEEALAALDLMHARNIPANDRAVRRAKPIVPVESEPILGHDDQPVGARERLADNVERLRLPDPADMTPMMREAAAEAFMAEIRRHFGLA